MKILIVFGTRPEAIKMCPLVKELEKESKSIQTIVCVTGQHREMLDQVLRLFNVYPQYDLNVMKQGQDLFDITTAVLLGLRKVLTVEKPDIVLVHGDTTTSMAAALSAYYFQIPVGHVEAGLRTRNIYSPWPEEMNRQITGRISSIHFSPTELSRQNLLLENVDEDKIYVTGNTVIDAVKQVVGNLERDSSLCAQVEQSIYCSGYDTRRCIGGKRIVLITGHRRENFGKGFESICHAIKELSLEFADVDFIYPMHLNPNVRNPIQKIFGEDHGLNCNLFFIEPLAYLEFVYLMSKSFIVLTDSGGIQEEAPGLGKPVLVMRDTTERPEALSAGTVKLVGSNRKNIVSSVRDLLNNEQSYKKMARAINPYGDGQSCRRIVDIIKSHYEN